jgi:hypothetical protein
MCLSDIGACNIKCLHSSCRFLCRLLVKGERGTASSKAMHSGLRYGATYTARQRTRARQFARARTFWSGGLCDGPQCLRPPSRFGPARVLRIILAVGVNRCIIPQIARFVVTAVKFRLYRWTSCSRVHLIAWSSIGSMFHCLIECVTGTSSRGSSSPWRGWLVWLSAEKGNRLRGW